VLEGARLDAAVLDEPVDFVFLEPDHTPESVGGNVTVVNGVATPALLRPSTGALFMFDSWATEGNDVSVAPARTIPGAVDLHPLDRGDGCSTLIVLLDDGTHQEIR
jgi:hypothetical protein